MASKVAIVIPVYKAELSPLEEISLAQCRKVLGRYPIIFVAPAGKNFPYFQPNELVAQFPPQCFQNVQAYNRLMMSPSFYRTFADFEYILIYELDAFVFRDELEYFCSLGYDYIGAPWPYHLRRNFADVKNVRVGNSGFCLRNVKAHCALLKEHANLVERMTGIANDDFFAYCGAREDINFSVPPVKIAARFSVEYLLKHSSKYIGGELPFGCHGWTKMDADFYVKLMAKFGYDLRPLRPQMNNIDRDMVKKSLYNFTMRRLVRRLNHGQSIMRYLPTKRFASIRVIRHPLAMMILARLLMEDSSLSDKIFLYSPDEQDILLNDLTPQKLPHLLIALGGEYDTSLMSAVKQKGFAYGKRIVSFQYEYFQSCEKIYRELIR